MFTKMTAAEFRGMDDEGLDEAWALVQSLRLHETGRLVASEMSRRAEICLNRGMDAEYGPNPYGFTVDGVRAPHDASWYESRQTEDQFLAEMGVEA